MTSTPTVRTAQITAPDVQTTRATAGGLASLAAGAKADRNRAVDCYRALAMLAVAVGHWMAIAVGVDADGELIAGNALASAPGMAWLTWIFQVMPLFFVVGGFSSAMSLDAHNANGGRAQDWVVARLRRMVAPAVVLAGAWLVLVGAAFTVDGLTGMSFGQYAAAGATAAAVPLWFLANYTIDTAIAPYVLPLFRRAPRTIAAIGAATFVVLEAVRFADLDGLAGRLPHLNWVLGWLLFQVMGFAWRDGLLPTGRRLITVAAGSWALAIAAVAFGPWPVSMVHFPGLTNSPTHPPSAALMVFGVAYASTALAAAPAVSTFLARNAKAWTAVVAANSIALSVYLWHMAAAAFAGAGLLAAGLLPTAEIGTGTWWIQKTPFLALSVVVLAAIVVAVSPVERRALLAPRSAWSGGPASMLVTAGLLSTGVKLWANDNPASVVAGMAIVTVIWFAVLRPGRRPSPVADRA